MNTENIKANESQKFLNQSTHKLNLKNPNNKNIGLVNLSIYYTQKNIKSTYNNNKFKTSAPSWNDEFDFPDGPYSISDIQDYFAFIIKKHKTLAESLPMQIKNRIFFKIKTGYKLELFPANNRLDEDVLKASFVFVFRTSWSRQIYSSCLYVKSSSRHLAKRSSRHLQDFFKTSSGRLEKRLQDIFKTHHQVKLFL